MALVDVFRGQSKAFSDALARLKQREDEVFKLQPGEMRESPIHAAADIRRFGLVNARSELYHADSSQKADRNWYTTLAIGGVLIAKGIIPLSWLAVALKWVGGF